MESPTTSPARDRVPPRVMLVFSLLAFPALCCSPSFAARPLELPPLARQEQLVGPGEVEARPSGIPVAVPIDTVPSSAAPPEDAALPPVPASPDNRSKAPPRLLARLAENLLVRSIVNPAMYAPVVESAQQIYGLVEKPHEIGWAPDMSWDLKHCELVTNFGPGYVSGRLKKVSTTTFRIYFSRSTGRIYFRWSDRRDARALWTTARMETSSIVASGWCHFDPEKSFAFGAAGESGLLMTIAMFGKLSPRSYESAKSEPEAAFHDLYRAQFISDVECEMFMESELPEKSFGWDTTRCHAHYIYKGTPGSRVVQWNRDSMRGLLRIISSGEAKVAAATEVHPNCTYSNGKRPIVGDIGLKDGRRRLIVILETIPQHRTILPEDLEEVPLRKIESVAELDDKASETSAGKPGKVSEAAKANN